MVLACGEVASCIREGTRKANRKCSCGREAYKCPVWGFFYRRSSHTALATHSELLSGLIDQARDRYSAIVDSSKTAWGSFSTPFCLRRRFGPEFTLVHLMREPTAVCWSVLKQKNCKASREGRRLRHYMLRCSWVILGWSLANLSCEIFGLIHPRHYVRLRYEDLVRSPQEELGSLLRQLLPKASWRPDEEDAPDNRHQLQGNKVRLRQLTTREVKEDLKWKREMPPQYSRIILPLSYLLRLRYGYR